MRRRPAYFRRRRTSAPGSIGLLFVGDSFIAFGDKIGRIIGPAGGQIDEQRSEGPELDPLPMPAGMIVTFGALHLQPEEDARGHGGQRRRLALDGLKEGSRIGHAVDLLLLLLPPVVSGEEGSASINSRDHLDRRACWSAGRSESQVSSWRRQTANLDGRRRRRPAGSRARHWRNAWPRPLLR